MLGKPIKFRFIYQKVRVTKGGNCSKKRKKAAIHYEIFVLSHYKII